VGESVVYIELHVIEMASNSLAGRLFEGLYVKILGYWFPSAEGYDITPQWTILNSTTARDNFKISFVVEDDRGPLLLVEIKAPRKFRLDSARQAAIFQISQRFAIDDIGPRNQHADRLYAISAFGKKWRHLRLQRARAARMLGL